MRRFAWCAVTSLHLQHKGGLNEKAFENHHFRYPGRT